MAKKPSILQAIAARANKGIDPLSMSVAGVLNPLAGIPIQEQFQGPRQAVAGLLLPFMDNPALQQQSRPRNVAETVKVGSGQTVNTGFEGYSPLAVDLLPAAAGSVQRIFKPDAKNYLTDAADRVTVANEKLHKFIGSDPNTRDPALIGANVIGGLAIPGGTPAKVVNTGTRLSKLATSVPRIAAEIAFPLRQTGVGTAAVTQLPLALGINAAVEHLAKPPTIKEVHQEAFDLDKVLDPNSKAMLEAARINGDAELEAEIINTASQAWDDRSKDDEQAVADLPQPAWKDPTKIALALAATGLGAAGIWSVRNAITKARLKGSTGLTGLDVKPEMTTLAGKASAGFVQADQPVRDALKKITGDDQSWFGKNEDQQLWEAKLDAVTSPALNTKIQHGLTTGELPNSALVTKPVTVTLEALAKDTDVPSQQVITDGLLARSALDDYKRTGVQSAFNDKTPQELEAIAQTLESDPKLNRYADAIKGHYKDQLDYMVEQGLITPEMRQEFAQARPNYVHMSKTSTFDDNTSSLFGMGNSGSAARKQLDQLLTRSEDEFGGVQVGATADPIRELPGQFANIVKKAEVNNIKKDFFDAAAGNKALDDFISKLPAGEQPKSMEGVHIVFRDGKPEYYKVKDPALSTALDFAPNTVKTPFSTVLGPFKKLSQTFITGSGNPLFASTSAMYDTLTGIMLRPKGYDLGLANEALNRAGSPITLGGLDPTAWISAPVGALRLAADELTGSLASDLSTRLMLDHDWFVQALGKPNAEALRDRLAGAYEASIKSNMDRYGASASNLFNSDDPTTVSHGLVDVAPKFYSRASEMAYKEALEGGVGTATAIIKGGKSVFEKVRASSLARAYLGTVKLLHEGFRYQAFASNLPKAIGDEDLMKLLAAKTRRVAADVGQTGSSQLYQEAARSALYLNTATQSLAEVGRKFKNQPITTVGNVATTLAMLTAMQYGYAGLSKENQEQIKNATDDEQTRTAFTFGGLTIPIPPELRMIWGPWTAVMNELTGITTGDYDPHISAVMEKWLDNGLTEEGALSVNESAKSALQALAPINSGSIPMVNAAMASQGIDLGMSRFAGKPMEIQGQKLSQLGGEGKLTDDALSATTERMINSLLGTTVTDYIRAAMDADRALGAGADVDAALEVSASRLKDATVRSAGPVRGLLFQNYERLQSANDTNARLYYKKAEGIDKATATLRQDLLQQYTTGADPRYAMLRNSDTVAPELSGTALAPIGAIAADLNKSLFPLKRRLGELKDQVDFTKDQKLSTIEARNVQANEFNAERKQIIDQMNLITMQAEDSIRATIGDPSFTFQNFDPDNYKAIPYPPQAPQEQSSAVVQ